MYKSKKGISGIITILIIIALVLVAVGVIWYVVQNVLRKKLQDTVVRDNGKLNIGLNELM